MGKKVMADLPIAKSGWLKMPKQIDRHKLIMEAARYAYHCQIRYKYQMAIKRQEMDAEQAKARYNKSMENYDEIIGNAPQMATREANAREMEKGFEPS